LEQVQRSTSVLMLMKLGLVVATQDMIFVLIYISLSLKYLQDNPRPNLTAGVVGAVSFVRAAAAAAASVAVVDVASSEYSDKQQPTYRVLSMASCIRRMERSIPLYDLTI
jgi:hypothetical protein